MGMIKGLNEILEDNLIAIENTATNSDRDMLIAQTLRVMATMIKMIEYKVNNNNNNNIDGGK